MVIVRPPEAGMFEEAIFIVKGDAFSGSGFTAEDIVREACRVAGSYDAGGNGKRLIQRIPAPLFSLLGGLVVGAAWLITALFF